MRGRWAVLAVGVFALLLSAGCGSSSDDANASDENTESTFPGRLTRIPMPTTTLPTLTTTPFVAARVVYECAAAPCKVVMALDTNEIPDPRVDSHVENGQNVRVQCQTTGRSVTNEVTGEESNVWYRLNGGPALPAVYAELGAGDLPTC